MTGKCSEELYLYNDIYKVGSQTRFYGSQLPSGCLRGGGTGIFAQTHPICLGIWYLCDPLHGKPILTF